MSSSSSSASWYDAASRLGFEEGDLSFHFSWSPFGDDRDLSPGREKRPRSADWSEDETTALLTLWADDYVQQRFTTMGRNKPIWEAIALEMRKLGYSRTQTQCKNKIDSLKAVYKKIKDSTNETGNERKSFKHFDLLNGVLGDGPSYSPVCSVSSMGSLKSDSREDKEDEDEEEIAEPKQQTKQWQRGA